MFQRISEKTDVDLNNPVVWQNSCRQGQMGLAGAGLLVDKYKKLKNVAFINENTEDGIYAYCLYYASKVIVRLSDLNPKPPVITDELSEMVVSHRFVQQMAPELADRRKWLDFKAGMTVSDLSGMSFEGAALCAQKVLQSASMGLMVRKFQEQFKLGSFQWLCPIYHPDEGPIMICQHPAHRKRIGYQMNFELDINHQKGA